MRVALLTGGGDCPGLNAVIYAAVKKGINHYGDEFIGFLNGWRGVLDNNFIPADAGKHRRHSAEGRHHPALLAHQREEDSRRH
jgi:6-phosphofructokinase